MPPPEPVVSPNGDGDADEQLLRVKLVRPSTVTVALLAPDGSTAYSAVEARDVGSFAVPFPPPPTSPPPPPPPARTTGPTAAPDPGELPDGRWRLTVEATDELGQSSAMSRAFMLNTTLGFLATAKPRLFLPPGGRPLGISWRQAREARVVVTVETAAGAVVRTLARRRYEAGRISLVWNGLDRDGRRVRGGVYAVRVVARNELGSVELVRRFAVQRTAGPRQPAVMRRRPRAAEGTPSGFLRVAGSRERSRDLRSVSTMPAVLVASILSGITEAVTTAIGDYGLYAVFLLMFVDAVFPTASEVVMVYAGAVAAGAFAGQTVTLFGYEFESGLPAYLAMALAGTIGYTLGSIAGWAIGDYGGRPYLERHGRWLHLDEAKLDRAQAWFERWEDWAVFLGRLTPVVRSFISVPAGVFRAPFVRYTLLTLAGSAIWCFILAGIGWALGANWETFHEAFRYADYAIAVAVAAGIGWLAWKLLARRRTGRAESPGLHWPLRIRMIPLVDVKAQYAPLIPELKERFAEALESGRFIFGPEVEAFEREAAAYLGVPHAIGVANGTDALVLALEAMGIGRGDEVICPSFTFYATAESIARVGATPVFADIDPATFNLDPEDVAERITPRTKALMPVHLFGRPAPLDRLAQLGLPLLEDAAQAFGAPGIATTGVCSTFSFFPTKNLFALGDGGLVACTDDTVADIVRKLRFHGSLDKKHFELIGTNSRLDAIQAAALRVFLPRLAGWNASRREAAARYAELGLGEAVELPADDPGHVYHMYVVRSPERDRIAAHLTEAGIASAAYYVVPTHLQPALRDFGWQPGSLPETERAAADNLALPMWGGIPADVQERVVETVLAAAGVAA